MTGQTEHVLQKLFAENSLDNIPIERLRQIANEHPYFTLGQLLLAKKLQSISAEEYEAQSEKAAIYFNEPMWLQTLLHPPSASELAIKERPVPVPDEIMVQESVATPEEIIAESPEPVMVHEDVVESKLSEEWREQEPFPATHITSEPEPIEQVQEIHQPTEKQPEQPVEEAPPIFEPYHTIDYFASQGIRVSNEIRPDDRLGHQLRSFTEWLKTMKRLPETKVDVQLDEVAQQNIQEFASHSLDEKEIVTESMAEVLVKQQKQEEAVLIYEKLSLLNPSKRAYFAAKIEQLKG